MDSLAGVSSDWTRSESRHVTRPLRKTLVLPPSLSTVYFFFFKWRSQVLFVEPLIRLFRTYGDACPGFQCQDGFPHLCASFPVHNRFLRFTFDATPADLLTTSMAAGLFHPYACEQALVWLESRKNHATASHHITRQTLYRLS